jgi:hypothetical protein
MSYPAGTLNLVLIQDALYDWVRDITQGVFPEGEEHIQWMNQSRPLQARPCVTLKIIDGPRPIARSGNLFFNPIAGQPLSKQTNPFTVGIQQEATLSVQVFGNTDVHRPLAMQLACDLNSSLIRQSVLDKLKSAGISVQEVGKPRNLTALEESEYEERAGFELLLGLAQNMKDQPGIIETVNASIETESGTQTKTIVLP